jgi:AraC-like DNA-binding protein
MERYRLANLALPPVLHVIVGGDFLNERREWVQPLDRWTAIYYQHANAAGINGDVFAVVQGTIVFFPPGVRATHGRIGDGTMHRALTFGLPAEEGEQFAIPLVLPNMERVFPDFELASDRIAYEKRPAVAFAWNLLWGAAQNRGIVREDKELYAAEDWIYRNMHRKIPVGELAEVSGVSHRHLLSAFWKEHRCSIQEFIKRKQVQEATRLLTATDQPIKEIAAKVGFHDLQAFNKMIRTRTGSSPRTFRNISKTRISQ